MGICIWSNFNISHQRQKTGETPQEFKVDVARLVRFTYPSAPENAMECPALQASINGVKDDYS